MWEGKDTSKLFEGISLSQSQKPPFHLSVPRCLFPAYPCISPYLCLYLFSLSPFSFLPLSVSSVSFAVSFLIWKQKYCPRIPKTRFSTQRTSICPRRQMTGSKREKEGEGDKGGDTDIRLWGTNDCLWIEGRQTWHVDKWQLGWGV